MIPNFKKLTKELDEARDWVENNYDPEDYDIFDDMQELFQAMADFSQVCVNYDLVE